MDTINGLPAHPLLVHFVVVAVPVTALVAIAVAVWPRARTALAVFPSILALVTLIAVPITTSAGEALKEKVGHSEAVEKHAALGDELILAVGPLFGLVALLWLLQLPAVTERLPLSTKTIATIDVVVRAATVAAAVAAIIMVILVGDSGARAVWGG
ncbi:DUF2231 domain-containing protein [Gordonia sp. (in: high G+C Gram-positive bacteria)]|uniref:DUF2231 domain-containing protein n=1 Tax=Gordonia sp. (in: high G+C Gram-positive bacteria) TaxID=84139 RepID=UPI0016BD24D7|nr:DUF2231 domain-containing protein [Gordonia sp. (in: high G+C Gram-positive bacteria)]NLG45062.1 hypothetical protein [Gordonia sp. (in: high G+C Gram-positive bacteria)]